MDNQLTNFGFSIRNVIENVIETISTTTPRDIISFVAIVGLISLMALSAGSSKPEDRFN